MSFFTVALTGTLVLAVTVVGGDCTNAMVAVEGTIVVVVVAALAGFDEADIAVMVTTSPVGMAVGAV